MSIINHFPLLIPDFYIACSIMVCKIRPFYKWCHPVGHPNLYDFKGFEIFKNYFKSLSTVKCLKYYWKRLED